MNIQAAAAYMKLGYRVRRPSWDPEVYFFEGCLGLGRHTYLKHFVYDDETNTSVEHKSALDDDAFSPDMEDLLADDYELITDNIRKHFNKHGQLEYNDGTDWDNWVPQTTWFD